VEGHILTNLGCGGVSSMELRLYVLNCQYLRPKWVRERHITEGVQHYQDSRKEWVEGVGSREMSNEKVEILGTGRKSL